MTLQELSQHFRLREQLARDKEMLESLEDAALPKAQTLTGMPHAPGVSDKVGDLAAEIAQEEATVMAYINTIEDYHTRMVFRLRFLRGLAWKEVAAVIGGRNTEPFPKK